MTTKPTREVCCQLCGWLGAEDKLLIAHNPFDAVALIYGCPSCKSGVQTIIYSDSTGDLVEEQV